MRNRDTERLKRAADSRGLSGEELAVQLAKTAGVERRIVVRGKTGTRVVRAGEPLKLQPGEQLLRLPIGVTRAALRQLAQSEE